jgi:ABC-2 type transport system ATP-binding protein
MFEFQSLTKIFNRQTGIENISFQVHPGEILGLLAPEMAGKTILMRLAAKIIRPDQGEIFYQDLRIKKVSSKVLGYIPQVRGIYPRAKVARYLVYIGRLNQLSKKQSINVTMHQLDSHRLSHLAEKRIGDLEPELQQKIPLLAAIMHNPEILLIDEPYAGLFQVNLELVETWIRQFKEQNKYIIIASRHLGKAEKICDRVCILSQGGLILNTSMREIHARVRENVFRLEGEGDISFLKPIREIQFKEEMKNVYRITLKDKSYDLSKLITLLNKNIKIMKFEQYRPDLNDIYNGLLATVQRRKVR